MIKQVVRAITDPGAELGESPLWDSDREVLWWVDILAGHIHCCAPDGSGKRLWDLGKFVSALARMAAGNLVVALQDGFGQFDPSTGSITIIAPVERDLPTNRFNDARVDPAGRLWAGSMNLDGAGAVGTLYRLDADLRCTPMIHGVTISNGISWSPDHQYMYYVDTPTQRVDMFDFDNTTGSITNRRPFVGTQEAQGSPDGITVDAEGHVWVAFFGGWCLQRYGPDGRMSGRLDLPVSNVTSCTFGGSNLDQLFITTATSGLSHTDRMSQPLAGAVFQATVDVPGLPTTLFAWLEGGTVAP